MPIAEDILLQIFEKSAACLLLKPDAPDFTIVTASDAYCRLTGLTRELLKGKGAFSIFPDQADNPTGANQTRKAVMDAIATKQQTQIPEYSYHIADPETKVITEFWWSSTFDPIFDAKGRVAYVLGTAINLTEKIKGQKILSESNLVRQLGQDRLNRFFMQAPAGICMLGGPDLVFELVNPLYQQLFPGREILGKAMLEAIPEVKGAPIWDVLQDVYQTGKTFEGKQLLIPLARTGDGPVEDRYFNFIYQARTDAENKVDGILVFVIEVTDMIQVQQELGKQKRIYEAITTGTPDLMYVWDLNYKFTYANNALLTMWGKTEETAIGKTLLENGYEPWHAAMHEREIDSIVATKQPVRGEVAFPHAVLGKRVYDYILVPVFGEQGEVVAVAGTTRDVSDRKAMEETLAETTEELQAINEEMAATNEEQAASNEELTATNYELAEVNRQLSDAREQIEQSSIMVRLAIEAANFGTWFIHSVTREFITDTRLKELFGYYPDEELSIEQALAQIAEDYRDDVTQKLENAIYGNGDYDVTYPVDGLHDQKRRWLRAIGNLKADPSGAFSAFTGVVMDVTEQHLDEQRKNDFIGMVSHELKTPLTSLTAIIQVSDSKLKSSEDKFLAGAMEKANLQVKRMSSMINGFLNVSRLESAKLLIDKKEFNLDELIEEVVKENSAVMSSHVIHFESCDHILVNADPDKIGSVLTNLISNAVKYSPKGKVVTISCDVIGDKAQVSVKDEGMGIKAADREKVFDRYYRVETNHTQHISGFGIGLYLSAEIVHRHEGDIWVESESGVGSTFYFSIPYEKEK